MLGGSSNDFHLGVERVILAGGGEVHLQRAGVTAIVGPNNAGKSTFLRELAERLARHPYNPSPPQRTIAKVILTREGTAKDLIAWIGENSDLVIHPQQVSFQRAQGGQQSAQQLVQDWQAQSDMLGSVAPFITFYGDAQGRFGIGGSAEMRNDLGDPPQHPVHYLQDFRVLLDEVSAVCEKIFRRPLTLDTLARTLRLRVGRLDVEAPRIDEITSKYRTAMAALPTFDEQGDGMRSLLGQLLPVVTGAYRLIIIDEPEAFLHPPQARALGSELGRLAAEREVQLLVATHDRSLLAGLLESGVEITVVRLERNEGPPTASQLDAKQLKELWTDPVLKYTNLLDGLFHRLVVLAEAENDCAFLAAALDSTKHDAGWLRHEILFLPTGGKEGMAKVAAALTAVNVPVVAAPDLDFINDEASVQRLVQALGCEWTDDLHDSWKKATADFRAPQEQITVGQVMRALHAELDPYLGESWTKARRDQSLGHMRSADSPWTALKEHGMSAFKGQAWTAGRTLIDQLTNLGIVVVKDGELERLAPEVSLRKGPGWLQAALALNAQNNAATQAHLSRILTAGVAKIGNA
jgi:hypothetical protein